MLLSGVNKCGLLGLRLAPRTGLQLLSPLGAMAAAQRGTAIAAHRIRPTVGMYQPLPKNGQASDTRMNMSFDQ